MWREERIERSWRVLQTLHGLADFVLIGGWGVFFWTHKLKSRDVDLYINQENFYRLQAKSLERGFTIKRNPRLKKFEVLIDDVETDVYTPFLCGLAVPCKDVFDKGWFSIAEGFKIAAPEVLLMLKAQAARERWHAEKGMKDRADLISLLAFADLNFGLLKRLARKYDSDGSLISVARRALRESRVEYRFLDLTYEKDGVRLRKLFDEKLGEITEKRPSKITKNPKDSRGGSPSGFC